jgi:hypothetical protein
MPLGPVGWLIWIVGAFGALGCLMLALWMVLATVIRAVAHATDYCRARLTDRAFCDKHGVKL